MRPGCLFVVMGATLMSASSDFGATTQDNPNTSRTGTLQWYASRAKAEGKGSLQIQQFPGFWEQINLDEAPQQYTILTAVPVSQAVQLETDTISLVRVQSCNCSFKGGEVQAAGSSRCFKPPSRIRERDCCPPSWRERHGRWRRNYRLVRKTSFGDDQYLLFLRGTACSNQVGLLGGGPHLA